MKVSKELYESVKTDIITIVTKLGWSAYITVDTGRTGLKAMYYLLNVISVNRAYNDKHPKRGKHDRLLPFDGRDYCFYYSKGIDDSHIATMLRVIKADIEVVFKNE